MTAEGPSSGGRPIRSGAPRTGRWIKVALVLSVAFNLLVIGSFVGRAMLGPPHFRPGADGGWGEARRMFGELPAERREVILDHMRGHRDVFDSYRDRVGGARKTLADLLEQGDASEEAIRAALTELGAREAEGIVAMREAIGDVAIAMTPEERRLFARRLLGREWRGYGASWMREGK